MLKGRYSTLILAVGLLTALALATPAAALGEEKKGAAAGSGSGIGASSGQQTISVSVEYTQSSGGGGAPVASTSTSAHALVHAPCYFWESGNGKDKAQWLNNPTGWDFASVGELEKVKALVSWRRRASPVAGRPQAVSASCLVTAARR